MTTSKKLFKIYLSSFLWIKYNIYFNLRFLVSKKHRTLINKNISLQDKYKFLTSRNKYLSLIPPKIINKRYSGKVKFYSIQAGETSKQCLYIVLLSCEVKLDNYFYIEVLKSAQKNNYPEVIYTDHDYLDKEDTGFYPVFKPGWSPELLLSYNYIGPLIIVRRDYFEKYLKENNLLDVDQYEILLDSVGRNIKHHHIPKILYSVRKKDMTNFYNESKCVELSEYLKIKNYKVKSVNSTGKEDFQYNKIIFDEAKHSVAVIIPTKNNKQKLKKCLLSLKKTTYSNYKTYIIDDNSDDMETVDFLKSISDDYHIMKISHSSKDFNFSHQINYAAKIVKDDYLLLLNDDTEVINPFWLNQMVGYVQFPGVGAVGAKLIYPNNTIQHAGVIHLHGGGYPKHSFRFSNKNEDGYLCYKNVARNYLAVTAACMLTPKKLFLKTGGFDEKYFAIAYNDVDYCFRLHQNGYRCVYCSDAELYHHEGASRGKRQNQIEKDTLQHKYWKLKDPYYNQNLIDMRIYDYNV